MKIYVVAGNHEQAKFWINEHIKKRQLAGETTLSLSEYVVVSSVINVRGVLNPHGYFVGTWKERKDLQEILQVMLHASYNQNVSLIRMYLDEHMKNSTPSSGDLRHFGTYQQVFNGTQWVDC